MLIVFSRLENGFSVLVAAVAGVEESGGGGGGRTIK